MITGFIAGDSIIVDLNVTGASFKQTTNTQGTLTLTNGAAIVGTLTLNGNYATSLFQVDVAGQTGVAQYRCRPRPFQPGPRRPVRPVIFIAGPALPAEAGAVPPTGRTRPPAPRPPRCRALPTSPRSPATRTRRIHHGRRQRRCGGSHHDGDVLLTGLVNVAGLLHVSPGSSPAGILALEAGAMLTAGVGAQIFGTLEVGGGSSAVIGGTAALSGGSLLVLDGSTVQVGVLVGNGDANVIAVDSSSVAEHRDLCSPLHRRA